MRRAFFVKIAKLRNDESCLSIRKSFQDQQKQVSA
jgi:hypothetical protein